MRAFGIIGLLLTLLIGAIIAKKQMTKLSSRPLPAGLGAPSFNIESGDAATEIQSIKKLPEAIEKDLKKIVKKREDIGD